MQEETGLIDVLNSRSLVIVTASEHLTFQPLYSHTTRTSKIKINNLIKSCLLKKNSERLTLFYATRNQKNNIQMRILQLEAQEAELVSLTCLLANKFQRRRFLMNQPIRNKICLAALFFSHWDDMGKIPWILYIKY